MWVGSSHDTALLVFFCCHSYSPPSISQNFIFFYFVNNSWREQQNLCHHFVTSNGHEKHKCLHPDSATSMLYTAMFFFRGGGAYSLFYIKIRMTPERTRPKRNQSEIAKKWRSFKHMKVKEWHSLQAERDRLTSGPSS
jgi:hypothetical protein